MANVRTNKKICILCLIEKKEEIDLGNDYFLLALEKPYMNLYCHKECYKSKSYDEIVQILAKNVNLWYN